LKKHPGVKPMKTIGGAFRMAKKGQKFLSYSFDPKKKAIENEASRNDKAESG
jgi:hypothetical protein